MENQVKDSDITVFELIDLLIKKKKILFSVSLLSIFISLVVSFTLVEKYSSTITVIHAAPDTESTSSKLSGLASFAGLDLGNAAIGDDALRNMAILQSKTFIINFLEKENLLPLIFPEEWDDENQTWRNSKPSPQFAYDEFINNFFVLNEDQVKAVIKLSITSYDPLHSSIIANKMIKNVNDYIRSSDLIEVNMNLKFLKEEAMTEGIKTSKDYFSTLIQQEIIKKMSLYGPKDYAFKVIDPALPPETRSSPVRSVIMIVGTILGIIISILGVMLNAVLTKYLKHREQSFN